MPLMFVPGMMGKIFRVIPLIVIPCLLFSLIESLGILPAHLSHMKKLGKPGLWRRFQGLFANGLKLFIRKVYQPSLEFGLRWRYLTAAVGVATLIVTSGMVLGGWTNFHFFPSIEADVMAASITLPQGTPASVTSAAVEKLEVGAASLRARLLEEPARTTFRHIAASVGDQPMASRGGGPIGPMRSLTASHVGEVTVELAPSETRAYTSEQLGLMWREMTGPIPEAVNINFNMSVMTPGDDVDIQLAGPNIDDLRAVADDVKRRLAEYAGVYEISDSFRASKEEMKLSIKPAAETLGLTLQDLGRQVRQAFYGEEAQRIQRGRDDIRVMVRYPQDNRRSLGDLENMRIRTSNGGEVPFSQVAVVEPSRGFTSIKRVNRNRAVNVTASVDASVTSAGQVISDLQLRILPEMLANYPGVFCTFKGAQAEQADAVGGLQRGFILALLMIFALLAVPLRSYVQPIIIMSAIPFGLVGAVWGHIIMGLDVTMMSMFGLVALSGVVVNDSLIMVDFINRKRRPPHGHRHCGARSGAQPFSGDHADVVDYVRRTRPADDREELRRRLHGADGGVVGVRRALRHLHHADASSNRLPDPRRPPANDAEIVRTDGAGGRRGAGRGTPGRERGRRGEHNGACGGSVRHVGDSEVSGPTAQASSPEARALPSRDASNARKNNENANIGRTGPHGRVRSRVGSRPVESSPAPSSPSPCGPRVPHPVLWTHVCATPPGVARAPRAPSIGV